MNVSEYDVVFAIKEWLRRKSWNIIAFNPPGAQGTFSIPNPTIKDPSYRGQTGTMAPDLIALKNDSVLIIECKDKNHKIVSDVNKLISIICDQQRVDLLLRHIKSICTAHTFPFPSRLSILMGVGHGGTALNQQALQLMTQKSKSFPPILVPELYTFCVTGTDVYWDNKIIMPGVRPATKFNVAVTPALNI